MFFVSCLFCHIKMSVKTKLRKKFPSPIWGLENLPPRRLAGLKYALKLVLCAGTPETGVLPELRRFMVSRSRSCGAFSQLWLESQNDKKCENFVEQRWLQITTILNLLKVQL
jgi:hypothetical protein